MIDFVSKFIGSVKDFFGFLFSLPSLLTNVVSGTFGIFNFLGEDVVSVLLAVVGVFLSFLVLSAVVRLVIDLL